MVRTNMTATRVKPAVEQLLTLRVVRSTRISPSFARVTLGGGDIDRFTPMGFDQWFRLFIATSESTLSRLPAKLDTLSYLRFLAIARTERPVLRNYTVRAFRSRGAGEGAGEGAELDVDFVLHGSTDDGTAGPAAAWALACAPGDPVALLDEGIAFHPSADRAARVVLVGDETAVPAAAGILSSLPREATGHAYLEIPDAADAQELEAPAGVAVQWIVRDDSAAPAGRAALAAATGAAPDTEAYHWAAGEQSLASGMRRHWVQTGVPKTAISFCGYWKAHR